MKTSIYWQFQLFRSRLLSSLNILRLKALKAALGDVDIGDKGVELVHRVLVLVPQPCQADAHAEGDTSHTLGPNGLVESCVNPHILGAHLLLSKLLDLLDSPGSLVLEANAMQPLVHVDGVLPRPHLSHSGSPH